MKIKLFLLYCLGGINLSAQQAITWEACQEKALANYPLIRQYDLITQSEHYTLDNASKAYLPQLSLHGQATWQSAVTKIPIDFSQLGSPVSVDPLSKDQYKATVDVNQLIWDGGNVSAQRKVARAQSEAERTQLSVTLYQIKAQVDQLYFGLLAITEQLHQLDLLEADLKANREVALSMFRNGTATQSDVDHMDVEMLNIVQRRIELLSMDAAYRKMLSLYTGEPIAGDAYIEKPPHDDNLDASIVRPELEHYAAQRRVSESQRSIIAAKNLPKLALFAQGGYARPGLNMLENKFKTYAIGGVKLTWEFGGLYTRRNELRQININLGKVNLQAETFLFNTRIQATQEQHDILRLNEQLKKDEEIIVLRERVKHAGESKYRNGVYTVNDLIRDINAENQARRTKALREIQRLQHIYHHKYLMGN